MLLVCHLVVFFPVAKLRSRARIEGKVLCIAWPAYSNTRTGVRATLVQMSMKFIRSATETQHGQHTGCWTSLMLMPVICVLRRRGPFPF